MPEHATLFDELEVLIQEARPDYEKAQLGVKAAGRRVRKIMQTAKDLAQKIRKEMLSVAKDME